MSPRPAGASSDAQLSRRIRSGDPLAEEALIDRFNRPVFLLLAARVRDAEVARDLTQDVLLSVVLSLRGGGLKRPDRLAAFVRGTARNLANNHLRGQQRCRMQPLPELCSSDPGPEAWTRHHERLELIHRALLKLAPRDQKILLWSLVDSKRSGEIARRLKMSAAAVRQRKSRALAKIRRVIRELSQPGLGSHLK